MKKYILILTYVLLTALNCAADSQTDRLMSRVLRDTNTYISADARAESEDKAYEQAIKVLCEKITDYFKEQGMEMPDAVHLSNISNLSERLISQSGSSRCRAVVYMKKSDLVPIGDNSNSAMLTKNADDSYTLVTTPAPDTKKASETKPAVSLKESSVLTRISGAKTQKEIQALLVDLKKSNEISGAAAFPISSANDFYAVVIDKAGAQVAILHCASGKWLNASSGEPADINDYANCSAYWLTIK